MQNSQAGTSSLNSSLNSSSMSRPMTPPHPVTQKQAMLQLISQQIEDVIHPYALPENYRLKIGFDMNSSDLTVTPKRCAFAIELCILDPYLHIVVKKVSSSFRESINQSIQSLEKNLKLVKKRKTTPHKKRKMLLMSSLTLLLAQALFLQGCAHQHMEKTIDTKLKNEAPVTSQETLQKDAYEAVEEDPNLTQDQKVKLLELQKNTRTKLSDLREKGFQLRSLLIKDLLVQDDNSDEVGLIKKRIKKNENEKISTLFSAIDRANIILGKDTKIRGKMLQAFMDRHWTGDTDADTRASR